MTEGLRVAPSAGAFYGEVILPDENEPTQVSGGDVPTGSLAIRAWDNVGTVYIGWDSDVDEDNGFPLDEGETLSVDINLDSEDMWILPETAGDSVRIISTN